VRESVATGECCVRPVFRGGYVQREDPSEEAQLAGSSAGVFSAVLLAYVALQTAGVAIIPVVTPFLQDRFTLSDAQIGLLTSAFALAVALVAIPMGLASSRWGGATLFAAAGLFVAGSLVLAAAGSYEGLLIGRFIQGLGAGAGIPVGTALITRFVAPGWRHRAFGLFGAGTGVGTVLTLLIMPSVAAAGGYRAVFVTAALIAVALAAAVASQRALRSWPAHAEGPDVRGLVRALGRAVTSGRVLLVAVVNFTTLGVVVGILTWTPQFLHDQYGATLAAAAYLTAAIGLAQIVGNPLGSLAMTRWGKARVLVVGLALTALTTALVPTGFGIAFSFAAVLSAVLISGAVFPPSLAVVGDVAHGNEAVGATTGLIGLTNVIGSVIAPWAFGTLLDTYGTAPGESGYTAGWIMLAGFAGAGALGAVGYALLRRRQGVQVQPSRARSGVRQDLDSH